MLIVWNSKYFIYNNCNNNNHNNNNTNTNNANGIENRRQKLEVVNLLKVLDPTQWTSRNNGLGPTKCVGPAYEMWLAPHKINVQTQNVGKRRGPAYEVKQII